MFDTGGPLASHLQPPPLPLSSHVSLPFHRDYRTTFVRRIVNDPADHCCSVWTVTGRDWNDHWSNSFDKRSFAKEIWASSESSLNWWSTRLWLLRIQLWLTLIRSLTKDIGGYLGYSTECNKTVESLNKSNRKIEKIIQNVKTLKHCIQRQGFGTIRTKNCCPVYVFWHWNELEEKFYTARCSVNIRTVRVKRTRRRARTSGMLRWKQTMREIILALLNIGERTYYTSYSGSRGLKGISLETSYIFAKKLLNYYESNGKMFIKKII